MRKVGWVANTTAVCGAQMLKDHARGRSSVPGQAHSELCENGERSDGDEGIVTLVTQLLPFGVKRWCIKQPCMM